MLLPIITSNCRRLSDWMARIRPESVPREQWPRQCCRGRRCSREQQRQTDRAEWADARQRECRAKRWRGTAGGRVCCDKCSACFGPGSAPPVVSSGVGPKIARWHLPFQRGPVAQCLSCPVALVPRHSSTHRHRIAPVQTSAHNPPPTTHDDAPRRTAPRQRHPPHPHRRMPAV